MSNFQFDTNSGIYANGFCAGEGKAKKVQMFGLGKKDEERNKRLKSYKALLALAQCWRFVL